MGKALLRFKAVPEIVSVEGPRGRGGAGRGGAGRGVGRQDVSHGGLLTVKKGVLQGRD